MSERAEKLVSDFIDEVERQTHDYIFSPESPRGEILKEKLDEAFANVRREAADRVCDKCESTNCPAPDCVFRAAILADTPPKPESPKANDVCSRCGYEFSDSEDVDDDHGNHGVVLTCRKCGYAWEKTEEISAILAETPPKPSFDGEALKKSLDKIPRFRLQAISEGVLPMIKEVRRGDLCYFQAVKTIISQAIEDMKTKE
jgi:hypothetical protein